MPNLISTLSLIDSLTNTIEQLTKERDHLIEYYAIERKHLPRQKPDHPLLQQFWDVYHELNGSPQNPQLNHSKKLNLIAINLNQFAEQCQLSGKLVVDNETLKELFPNSRRHVFVGVKKVRSRVKSGAIVRCWIFANTEAHKDAE